MLVALTHIVSPLIEDCELTYVERERVDYERAVEQHAAYCRMLERCGAKVVKLTANAAFPDSCFIEDTAIVTDDLAIVTRMGALSRRDETAGVEKEIVKYRNVERVALPATIEGGDCLQAGKNIYIGVSCRTNEGGVAELKRLLEPRGYRVTSVEVKKCLHLKTACTFLNDETLLANPRWVDLTPFENLNILHVPESEPWAANAVRVNGSVCVDAGSTETFDLVSRVHDRVEQIDVSEFRKAEGSLTCLSIIFDDNAQN
ncbi:MAG: dimethylargininase [Pyrinomonadaceae bacterium]|nr:dimethylargininase [Pyrinomonadaceae bacterium]